MILHTRQVEDIKFLLVGSGSEKDKLLTKSENMGLPNVVFIPHQPKEVIRKYWSLCDVALIHLRNIPVFGTVIPSKMFEVNCGANTFPG